ncbi:MAG: hypothetical protein KQI78_09920 [Deltaproteobacteria bacterium]|nr:hypothetical protein [Deltaproteobacteria bacterium]
MGSYLSAEEIKQNYIQKLGSDFGYLYYELWYEVSILHLRWDEYVELFGTNPSWIELLNDSAPRFFRTVQDALWESTLLHITRLTDPIKSCGKENLSIQCLLEFIDADIKPIISEQIKDAVTKSKFCRDWRNRQLESTNVV